MSNLNNWPDPDMSILNPPRPPAPVLSDEDLEAVFGSWASWLKDAANVKGATVDYVGLSLLCSASSLIGNARWAKPWEGWTEPTIIWAMLIGDPSSGKSPALDAVLDPIKEIERAYAEAYESERLQWEATAEIANIASKAWKRDVAKAAKDGCTPPPKPKSANAGPSPKR